MPFDIPVSRTQEPSYKPPLRTKFKTRISRNHDYSMGQTNPLLQKKTSKPSSLLGDSMHNKEQPIEICNSKEFSLDAGINKKYSLRYHHPHLCVCQECNCGRHLCKTHVVVPTIPKSTIYKQDFKKKPFIPNQITKPKCYPQLSGRHSDIKSTYNNDFPGLAGDRPNRFKPQNMLQSSGPSPRCTSYSLAYPGFIGPNQYIRPNSDWSPSTIPFKSQSTYNKNYTVKSARPNDYSYFPDQIKTGKQWLGATTYGDKFQQPNPEDYAKKQLFLQKLEKTPGYNHQYETTYKKDFLKNDLKICPAKIALEKILRTAKPEKHTYNSDQKALHGFSTSKHSFL